MADLEKSFNFFVPLDISKSGASEDSDGKRIIKGIASVEKDGADLQNDIVMIKGMDTSYFEKYGFINDDHKPGPGSLIGEPLELRKVSYDGYPALFLKAVLYKGKKAAEEWWEHLHSLKKSDATRKAGFSIQGKTIVREGKKIVKSWIYAISLTANPINVMSFCDVVKSLANSYEFSPEFFKSAQIGYTNPVIENAGAFDINLAKSGLTVEQLERLVKSKFGESQSRILMPLIIQDLENHRSR